MKRIALILSLILLLLPMGAYAQSSAIDAGVGYLTSTQNPDRSWGGTEGSTGTVASTVTVLDTLKLLNQADLYEYSGAVSWLQNQNLDTTEHLSERINTLTIGGADADRLLTYLDRLMNAWGGYNDYGVSIIDTVQALQALKTINHSDSATFAAALGYLTTAQNSDGGWGFFKGDASNTYVTSLVLRTLADFKSTYAGLEPTITRAVTFVLSKQDNVSTPPGGFGSSPSTVHETALAYEALVTSGVDVSAAIPQAITYLTQTQQQNGSWNNDAYATALALQALSNVKPNLSVSSTDITLSDANLTIGEHITISAIIKNTGMVAADRVVVNIYDNDPLKGALPLTSQIIGTLSAGSQITLSIPYTVSGIGSHAITVWVDPLSHISEVTTADNMASRSVWGATLPDVAVLAGDITPSTFYPASGASFDVSFKLRNLGETEAYPVNTALYDGDPAQGGTVIGYGMVTTVKAGETRGSVVIGAVLTIAGQHTLYLVANYDNQVTESSLANNTASFTVNVGGTQPPIDIVVPSTDLTVTPARPATGEVVQISALVRNQGQDTATGFLMEFYDGDPSIGGVLIASQAVNLAGGNEQTVTANWAIPSGIHTIYAIADRTNLVGETDELNNRAMVAVMADMVDIAISATDLSFDPSHPVSGDSVTLNIIAHNTGIRPTGPFNLTLYNGDPNAGGTLVQTYAVNSIQGDGSATVTYTFTASPQTYRFYAVADSEGTVTEMYEDNNLAIRSLKIKAPGEVLGPDLVPVKIDVSSLATDPLTLAISGNAQVTFQNRGDDSITTPFSALVFEDKDDDARYTAGVDTTLGSSTFVTGPTTSIPAIWPEGAGMVDVPLAGTVTFLHSPLYALIDSGDVILEQDETNNLIRSGADCAVVPLNPIQPALTWKLNKPGLTIPVPPVVTNLIDTNNDNMIDTNDIPSLIFATRTYSGSTPKLWAVRGDTGAEIFTLYDTNHPLSGSPYIAVGDLDNDGLPEIVVPRKCDIGGCGLLVYEHDGALKWDNQQLIKQWRDAHPGYATTIDDSGMPVIADLDGDGTPEIIMGATVINADGTVRWGKDLRTNFYAGTGSFVSSMYYTSTAVDLDLDGRLEIVAGNAAYKSNGTFKWWSNTVPDGITAIANFDDDAYPDIVLVTIASTNNPYPDSPRVYLLDHNGSVKWGPVYLKLLQPGEASAGGGGAPIIADFDGDGEPEIGVKGFQKYLILDKNGNLKQTLSIPYVKDGYSAPTVFDLNGNGRPKVLDNSNNYFRVFDGKDGTRLYETPFGVEGNYQNVIVADVNGDGHAEVVTTGYDYGGRTGDVLRVYSSSTNTNPWAASRKVWNQPNYHVTNVNDDSTIPQHEAPSWLLNNTFRCQARVGSSPNPYLTPNLTVSMIRATQDSTGISLNVRIGNGGAIASPASVTVTFYDGNPSANVVIGTAATTKTLQPGEYQDLIYSWTGASLGLHHIYAVVDAAKIISECREDDNQASADITVVTGFPDLAVGAEDITLPSSYYEGSIIPITVNVRNLGAVYASNVTARLYNGNPTAGGTQLGLTQTISAISAGGSVSAPFAFDTLGKTGTNVLYIVLDQENSISEASESNNVALVTLNVQPPVLPNLTIAADGIQATPANPREGEQVIVTATVTNRGAAAGNVPVQISVRSLESGVSSQELGTKTIYPILSLGQSATVNATFDTAGLAGQRSIVVTIDPENLITESDKTDNSASKPIFIQSAGLTSSVLLDKAAYQANENMTASITLVNAAADTRSLVPTMTVKDSAGNLIATIASGDAVTLGPNGTMTLTRAWNTGINLAGNYSVTTEVAEGGVVISKANTGFTITADKSASATVTVDKVSYKPNETAALTSIVTSQSANYIQEHLSANLTIAGSGVQGPGSGIIYTETKPIATLMPGASYTFKSYWNAGTYAPGAYPVLLEVRDAAGSLITSGTQTITISGSVNPSALLRGQVSVDKQSLMAGEPVNVSYSATNIGNTDIPAVTFSVQTVHVLNQSVYDNLISQATLSMGGSYTGSGTFDTTTYSAKDYLVVLRANINGIEETLAGTYFRVEGAPTAPALIAPAMGTDVDTFTPALTVSNASDPNDDKLTYEFELYADSGMTQLIMSSGASSQESGVTYWQVPVTLSENATYYWRARAYDGMLYGSWMDAASFRVNTVNEPPTAPVPLSPADLTSVSVLTPVLTVTNASDPESANLTYNFQVALDPDFTQIVATTIGVFESQGTTSWQVSPALSENTVYYWRAQADDWQIEGPSSSTATFFVNTTNEAPAKPMILSPADNAVVTGLYADILLQNSTDIDSPVISYYYEVDIVPSFDSGLTIRSGFIPPGPGTTTWQATGLLDNTLYYVRAMASDDSSAESGWTTPAVSFFVNTVNDRPTKPVIANPSIGAEVNVLLPTLTIHNATDPDRDQLTYDFEVYSDAGFTIQVTGDSGQGTVWTVPVSLTENQTYYWRARAFDGSLHGDWAEAWFVVNTANDAPGAPALYSPLDGATLATFTPTLSVTNAVDPDKDALTYEFEVSSAGVLAAARSGISTQESGVTSWTVTSTLNDNTTYQWRARAYDGDRSGPWTAMATFTVHVQQVGINVEIDVEPETLNQKSNGNWVMVKIELPHGYRASDVDLSSIRLEGVVPAETRPYDQYKHHLDNGCEHDHAKHDHDELKVKFDRSSVIGVLPNGDHVPVHVTGRIGSATFEGMDFIRVIH